MLIDLNADLGEGAATDAALLAVITSANIACGGHAGDDASMRRAVRGALARGVGIGAHPSYPDREGFGRRAVALPREDLVDSLAGQIDALRTIAEREGGGVAHVKAHGALYNQAAVDDTVARAVARGVARAGRQLILVGLCTTDAMRRAAEAEGVPFAGEAFADRRYNPDGTLQSRRVPGSVITDPASAAAQALRIAREGLIEAAGGATVRLCAQTLCVHGDNPAAVHNARAVRRALEDAGIEVRPLQA